MKLIVGIRQAAKFLQIDRKTVARRINRGDFPEPDSTHETGRGTTRVWTEETLSKVVQAIRDNRKYVRRDYRKQNVRRPR